MPGTGVAALAGRRPVRPLPDQLAGFRLPGL